MGEGGDAIHGRGDQRSGWVPHLLGVALGILVTLSMWGLAHLGETLMEQAFRANVWASRAHYALLIVAGMVLAVVTMVAPRLPALPTTLSVVFVYGIAASPFLSPIGHRIPDIGPWMPTPIGVVGSARTTWDGTLVAVFAGAMTFAAIWGWWGYRRDRQR